MLRLKLFNYQEMIDDDIFVKQLRGTAGAFFESADLAVTEALNGHYPGISQKEIEALKTVFWTARDLAVSDYIEVILRIIGNHSRLFQTERLASETIDDLISKGILRRSLEWVTYGTGDSQIIKPSPCVQLQPTVQDELMEATTELEHRCFIEYFPRDKSAERL